LNDSGKTISPSQPGTKYSTSLPNHEVALSHDPESHQLRPPLGSPDDAQRPLIEVVIEVPRGSFVKRGSTGRIDFISPLPCPFNYGSVPEYLGLDGDLLDALVLGPRLPLGARIKVAAWGAVIMVDRGKLDHKLVCGTYPPDASQRRKIRRFFRFYAKCKGLLNMLRGQPGRNACEGWCDAAQAISRARARDGS